MSGIGGDEWFVTWSTQWVPDENLYYVRLDQMEVGSCKTLWAVDYGRFKTWQEAHDFVETLPDPEETFKQESLIFDT